MKLADLNPSITGTTGGLNELTFDCPKCGKPYRIRIVMRLNGPTGGERPGVWSWTFDENDIAKGITVSPSIQNNDHGRKKSCGYHCSILNGEIVP